MSTLHVRWEGNWGSETLNVYDPGTATTIEAPAGVIEPHHFALDSGGSVWVSDNGGSSVVGFLSELVAVEVGRVPHHLAFAAGSLVVAVSSTGGAVLIRQGRVVVYAQLTPGLHGVAVVELTSPLAETSG